jgi:acid phosphatase type 7
VSHPEASWYARPVVTRRSARSLTLGAVVAVAACQPPEDSGLPAEAGSGSLEPPALMLSWQRDPTTTMTVDWHTALADEGDTVVHYKRVEVEDWQAVTGDARPFELFGRTLHRAELTGLEPETDYVFRVGEYDRVYRFRTMPRSLAGRSIVFATGGDTQHVPALLRQTNQVVMEHDPDFVVWGGDLAYANGGESSIHRLNWAWWFETNLASLVGDDGRVVPIIVAIGNHEVRGGYYKNHEGFEATDAWRERIAPYFYNLFAFPGHPGYGALDFGDYLSLVVLDSDHTSPIDGAQRTWLDRTLAERGERGVSHVLPIYHVPAFPSHRSFEATVQTRVREEWVPLFEAHGVSLAFESHDHAYKRTHPIRGGEIDPDDGIVYMGDGAWGVSTRSGDSKDEWYIDEFASERHAIVVTLEDESLRATVVSEEGAIIDEYAAP